MVSSKEQLLNFSITHMDSMGQGVHKDETGVYFVTKTLPGDKGIARIKKKSKGVHFAEVLSLVTPSALRVTSECQHFDHCGGCHYLNTSYENELELKSSNIKRLLQKFPSAQDMIINPSPKRLSYRNRLQLHYNKKRKLLGLYQQNSHKIVPIQNCLIAHPLIKSKLQQLYDQNSWLELVKKDELKGTIELYLKDEQVSIAVNQNYAHLGFTQVNDSVNKMLCQWVSGKLDRDSFLLELFAGSGNLTKGFDNKILIDFYPKDLSLSQNQYSFDLYQKDIINKLKTKVTKNIDTLVLDPPRSGLKNLKDFCQTFTPKKLLYISCNPQTFKRDLDSISPLIKQVEFATFDLFPGTYHLEIAANIILH